MAWFKKPNMEVVTKDNIKEASKLLSKLEELKNLDKVQSVILKSYDAATCVIPLGKEEIELIRKALKNHYQNKLYQMEVL